MQGQPRHLAAVLKESLGNVAQDPSSLRPILWDFVQRPFMIKEVFRPRWQLLVTFVKVPAVVAQGTRSFGSVADSPNGSPPDPAM